jgi:hypothetical protein
MCDRNISVASACAGKSMALDTIWIAIASVLSVYNITKAVDERGNVITPQIKLQPGTVRYVHASVEDDALTFVISHPAPFECVIEPRSAAALALIQHAHLEAK